MGKENSKKNRFIAILKKNGITILLGIFLIAMVVSPDVKSWAIRQLMVTGIFNAHIDNKNAENKAKPVSSFRFQDENGEIKDIAALKGKVVFINFWASWCPPCRAEMPSIMSLYEKYKTDPDLVFLMLNEDNAISAAKAYLEKEGYEDLPIYKLNSTVSEDIYSGVLPTTLVLDKAGNIRYHHKGFANYGSEKFLKQMEQLMEE